MAQTATKPRDENHAEASGRGSHGTFCWNELMTRDVERAKKFYEETIGWTFSPMPMADGGTYWCAMVEGRMSYLAVDAVDKRVAKAVKAGAKLMKPLFDIPGVGRIAILREPGGAGVGWMTPVTACR